MNLTLSVWEEDGLVLASLCAQLNEVDTQTAGLHHRMTWRKIVLYLLLCVWLNEADTQPEFVKSQKADVTRKKKKNFFGFISEVTNPSVTFQAKILSISFFFLENMLKDRLCVISGCSFTDKEFKNIGCQKQQQLS